MHLIKKLHISKTIGSYYDLNITSIGHKFKPAYQKNGSFRLVPEYDTDLDKEINIDSDSILDSNIEYEILNHYKYPIAQESNEIEVNPTEVWDSSDNGYLWKFEEVPFAYPGEINIYIGKYQKDKVVINVPVTGKYTIETIGDIDTYFESIISRSGTGNISTLPVCSEPNNDSGINTNARYTDVEMQCGVTYILTLRCYGTSAGNTTLRISGNTPNYILENKIIRTDIFTIDDSGRFNNSYDIINIYSIYGKTISSLISQGYSKIKVKIKIDICEVDDGYQYLWIYDGSGSDANILWTQEIEHKIGELDSNYRTYIFEDVLLELSQIKLNKIYVRYGASGSNDDNWKNKNLILDFIVY